MTRSICTRLMLSITVLICIVSAAQAFLFLNFQRQSALDDYHDQAHVMADTVSEAVANDLYFLDLKGLREKLATFRVNRDIKNIYVLDEQGLVVADGTSENPLRSQRLPDQFLDSVLVATDWTHVFEENELKVGGPILLIDQESLGRLYISYSLASFHRAMVAYRNSILLGVAVMIVLGMLLGFLVARQITRPIINLRNAAERIRAGDSETAIPLSGSGEIGVLAESMQQMMTHLNRAHREASDLNESLEALVQKRTEELRTVATAFEAQEGITITDKSAKILRVNRAFCNITGYTLEEVRGRTPALLKSGRHDRAFYKAMWGSLLEHGHWEGEIWNRRKNREIFPEWLSITAVKNKKGQTTNYVGHFQDISDRKLHEQELQQAKETAELGAKAKAGFLAAMSHELRTPMNGILGMAQILDCTELTSEQAQFLDTLTKSGQALLTIVDDILDFSKIEADRLDLDPITFDVEQAIHDVCQLLVTKAEEKGLNLLLHFDPKCPQSVVGDAGRFRQILVNLVGNAIKFTKQGHVLVRVKGENQGEETVLLQIEVEDTGIGIDEKALGRLFEVFTQADASTTRQFGGTGLGLAISKQLAELMGGQVSVDSTPGEGSTFLLYLPLLKADEPAARPQTELTNVRCLVVDEIAINRQILESQLTGLAMEVALAASGEVALQSLRQAVSAGRPFQLALLDYSMSGMDGERLAQLIKSDPDLASTPLIMLSSVGTRGDASRISDAGFSAYLTKPVLTQTLRQTLAEVLGLQDSGEVSALLTRHSLMEVKNRAQNLQSLSGHILLAEDDRTNQMVAIAMLAKLGLTVDIVSNGCEVLTALEKNGYDLILMDCQMPEMDGYEAARQVRAREGGAAPVPIIALTADAQRGTRQKCLDAGMDDYMSKPFRKADLEIALRRWLCGNSEEPIRIFGSVNASEHGG